MSQPSLAARAARSIPRQLRSLQQRFQAPLGQLQPPAPGHHTRQRTAAGAHSACQTWGQCRLCFSSIGTSSAMPHAPSAHGGNAARSLLWCILAALARSLVPNCSTVWMHPLRSREQSPEREPSQRLRRKGLQILLL